MTLDEDMACREFVELVTDYLEDVLPPDLRIAFEQHLAVCTGCRLYLGQMRVTVRALHSVTPGELSHQTREQLLRQFRAWRAGHV